MDFSTAWHHVGFLWDPAGTSTLSHLVRTGSQAGIQTWWSQALPWSIDVGTPGLGLREGTLPALEEEPE